MSLEIERSAPIPEKKEIIVRSLIGGVLFDGGQKLFIIGEGNEGNLYSETLDSESYPGIISQISEQGRITNLPKYKELSAYQVDLNATDMAVFPSINKHRTLSIRFPSANLQSTTSDVPSTKNFVESMTALNEMDILQIFSGEKGGIVVFSGGSIPDENALLVPKGKQGERGILYFFHPRSTDEFGFDSVSGLDEFVSQLNDTFTLQSRLPLQNKAVAALRRCFARESHEGGYYTVREQLYTLKVIALARLAEKSQDSKYREQLEQLVPGIDSSLFSKFKHFVHSAIDVSALDDSIQRILILSTSDMPVNHGKTEVAQAEIKARSFSTDKAAILFRSINNDYCKTDNLVTRTFMSELGDLIADATSEEELNDAKQLINLIFKSQYRHELISYCINFENQPGSRIVVQSYKNREDQLATGETLIGGPAKSMRVIVEEYLLKRELELTEKNKPENILPLLQTPIAKDLWSAVIKNQCYESDNEASRQFLMSLAELCNVPRNRLIFEDSRLMLRAMAKSKYGTSNINSAYTLDPNAYNRLAFDDNQAEQTLIKGRQLIHELLEYISNRETLTLEQDIKDKMEKHSR